MSYWQGMLEFWERQLYDLDTISIKEEKCANLRSQLADKYQLEILAARRQLQRMATLSGPAHAKRFLLPN